MDNSLATHPQLTSSISTTSKVSNPQVQVVDHTRVHNSPAYDARANRVGQIYSSNNHLHKHYPPHGGSLPPSRDPALPKPRPRRTNDTADSAPHYSNTSSDDDADQTTFDDLALEFPDRMSTSATFIVRPKTSSVNDSRGTAEVADRLSSAPVASAHKYNYVDSELSIRNSAWEDIHSHRDSNSDLPPLAPGSNASTGVQRNQRVASTPIATNDISDNNYDYGDDASAGDSYDIMTDTYPQQQTNEDFKTNYGNHGIVDAVNEDDDDDDADSLSKLVLANSTTASYRRGNVREPARSNNLEGDFTTAPGLDTEPWPQDELFDAPDTSLQASNRYAREEYAGFEIVSSRGESGSGYRGEIDSARYGYQNRLVESGRGGEPGGGGDPLSTYHPNVAVRIEADYVIDAENGLKKLSEDAYGGITVENNDKALNVNDHHIKSTTHAGDFYDSDDSTDREWQLRQQQQRELYGEDEMQHSANAIYDNDGEEVSAGNEGKELHSQIWQTHTVQTRSLNNQSSVMKCTSNDTSERFEATIAQSSNSPRVQPSDPTLQADSVPGYDHEHFTTSDSTTHGHQNAMHANYDLGMQINNPNHPMSQNLNPSQQNHTPISNQSASSSYDELPEIIDTESRERGLMKMLEDTRKGTDDSNDDDDGEEISNSCLFSIMAF